MRKELKSFVPPPLWVGFRRLENQAWETVVEDLSMDLPGHLHSKLRTDPDTVTELFGAIMAKAVESIRNYDPQRGSPRQWIYGIAANEISRFYRENKRTSVKAGLPLSLSDVPDQAAKPASEWNREDIETLDQIPHDVKAMLLAFHCEGRRVKSIAAESGLTPKQVEHRLRKWRARIRRMLVIRQGNGS
ncbi:MAG TPA: sigma-70 family RNA polymerase sigma factor [Planctomycetota bacterium]